MAAPKINWRLRACGEPGALTGGQITELAKQFNFAESQLAVLSVVIGKRLHPNYYFGGIGQLATYVRGPKELEMGLAKLRKAEKSLSEALEYFQRVSMVDPHGRKGSENPFVFFRRELHSSLRGLRSIQKIFARNARTRTVLFEGTADKRLVRDDRRSAICRAIFDFWEKSGRSLTFTTETATNERRGQLFAFVNAVVACVTDPAAELSGHTLYDELAVYKDGFRRPRHRRGGRDYTSGSVSEK